MGWLEPGVRYAFLAAARLSSAQSSALPPGQSRDVGRRATSNRASATSRSLRNSLRRMPDLVQVGELVAEERDLHRVPPAVAAVADVQGLVDVLDEVDDVAERHPAPGLRRRRVGQDAAELGEAADDAVAVAVAVVVARGVDRHVDEVPRGAAGDLARVLVGPGGGVGQALPLVEQLAHGGAGLGREPALGQAGGRAMGVPPPGEGRRRQGDQGRQGERDGAARERLVKHVGAAPGRGARARPGGDARGPDAPASA